MAKSGFVAVIGRPNVGKSTLVNALVGEKVAITSDKPQTTRNILKGILTTAAGQAIFLDTPGLHRPLHKLGEAMVEAARETLSDADLVLFVVDAAAGLRAADRLVAEELKTVAAPVVLVLNKIDQTGAGNVQKLAAQAGEIGDFAAVAAVSASTRDNLPELERRLMELLPEGPPFYPPDLITDQQERFICAEFVREKVLELTREEVPHAVAVETESFEESEGLARISATIYVERDSQKGIVIGKNGQMLKAIGTQSRLAMEAMLGHRVFLELRVKVKKDWREDEKALRGFGYR